MEGEVAMLKVSLSDGDLWSQTVIGIPFYQGPEKAIEIPSDIYKEIEMVMGKEFKGKVEETYSIPLNDKKDEKRRVILFGLGKKVEDEYQFLEAVRRGFGSLVKRASKIGVEEVSTKIPRDDGKVIRAASEGAILSTYKFDKYKTKKEEEKEEEEEKELKELKIFVSNPKNFEKEVEFSEKVCEGVFTAREVADTPSSDCNPQKLEELARELGKELGLKVRSIKGEELVKMGMNGIWSVGKGSEVSPRLITLEYEGPNWEENGLYVVIGKAVTFDSGGLSIKPSHGMEEMKFDKSGGAAVLGIVKAVAKLKLPVKLIGLIPAVENLPSGSSYKPGDVIRHYNGTTTEVVNTDAEGRLILADAIAYASEMNPKAIIDLATLTGACVIALGNHAAGLFTKNDDLAKEIEECSEITGERVWRLPLWEDYFRQIKSEVADVKNVGGRAGGAITAAAFLSKFASKPWVHLDIAGTAWIQDKSQGRSYLPKKGATGFGVRLIVEYLRRKTEEKK